MTKRSFSASVFLRYDRKLLLIKHNLLKAWLPVGGQLEPGETPLEAAKREVLEETGLTPVFPIFAQGVFPGVWPVPQGTPPGFLGYEEHETGVKGLHMNFCFLADVSSDQVKSDGSFSEHVWIDPMVPIPRKYVAPNNVWDIIELIRLNLM